MSMGIDQVGIMTLGAAAVWLSQHRRPGCRRWACIAGLAAQPFWLYATWRAGQWGIFAISFVYVWAWARGLRLYWLAPGRDDGR